MPSPTFTLVQLYEHAAGAIWHFDLYRLGAPEDAYELGIEDAFSGAISLIEWPEKLGAIMPGDWLQVHLAPGEGEEVQASHYDRPSRPPRACARTRARPRAGAGRVSDLDRERERQCRTFAADAGWGHATHAPLAGDASARRYARLTQGDATAVLMDDPPPEQSVAAFVRIARLLRGMGYSAAPEVLSPPMRARASPCSKILATTVFPLCSPAPRPRPSNARFMRRRPIF